MRPCSKPFMRQDVASLVALACTLTGVASAQCEFQKLQASDGQSNDLVGTEIAIVGDRAILGARGDDDPAVRRARALGG